MDKLNKTDKLELCIAVTLTVLSILIMILKGYF